MSKGTPLERGNPIVQIVKTYGQGVEAAAKRIGMEIEQRKRQMGPVPDPRPKEFALTDFENRYGDRPED